MNLFLWIMLVATCFNLLILAIGELIDDMKYGEWKR